MTPKTREPRRRLLAELRREWTSRDFQDRVRREAPFIDVADAIIGLRDSLGLSQADLAAKARRAARD